MLLRYIRRATLYQLSTDLTSQCGHQKPWGGRVKRPPQRKLRV